MAELHDLLQEGTPERPLADKYQTVSELAKGYKSLETQFSASVRVPGEDASPTDKRAFFTRMGAPASAEGYVLPEGADGLSDARQAAFDSGVTGSQWDAMTSKIMATQVAATSAREQKSQAQVEAWRATSKEEHGDGLDEIVAKADRFYEHYKVEHPEIGVALDPVIAHPEVLRMMAGLADSGSHQIPTGGMPAGAPGPQALVSEIRTLMATDAWNDKTSRHPERPEVMRKYKAAQKSLADQGYEGINDPKLKV